ncbi:hypothetical protein [Ensifer sp. SSB1]|nr:hypothetical protein [Ensifer sp. SSB1]MBK5569830.1 hypothetical protein [Ensifer sp. SSB1]
MRITVPFSLWGMPGTPLFDGWNYAAEAAGMVRFVGEGIAVPREKFSR